MAVVLRPDRSLAGYLEVACHLSNGQIDIRLVLRQSILSGTCASHVPTPNSLASLEKLVDRSHRYSKMRE